MATPDPTTAEYLRAAATDFGGDHAADYAMILNENGRFVGSCGLMPRIGPAALEIGYWVDVRHVRRGIATEAARLLTSAALGSPGISRVEIHVDEMNDASNAVPRRLGYTHDQTEPRESTAPGASNRLMIWIMNRHEWVRHPQPAAGVAASGRIAERESE